MEIESRREFDRLAEELILDQQPTRDRVLATDVDSRRVHCEDARQRKHATRAAFRERLRFGGLAVAAQPVEWCREVVDVDHTMRDQLLEVRFSLEDDAFDEGGEFTLERRAQRG